MTWARVPSIWQPELPTRSDTTTQREASQVIIIIIIFTGHQEHIQDPLARFHNNSHLNINIYIYTDCRMLCVCDILNTKNKWWTKGTLGIMNQKANTAIISSHFSHNIFNAVIIFQFFYRRLEDRLHSNTQCQLSQSLIKKKCEYIIYKKKKKQQKTKKGKHCVFMLSIFLLYRNDKRLGRSGRDIDWQESSL